MLSTLLYGSESWTTYVKREKKLNSFHMRCLRRLLHIHWEEKVPDTEVRVRPNMNSMFAMLSERRLRWLGHVKCMEPGHIPKDILYGELTVGKRPPSLAPGREAGRESCRGEQEGNGSPEKTEEERGVKPVIPPCLHKVQQRLQIVGWPLQPLAQLSTTVMLYHCLSQTDRCRQFTVIKQIKHL